MARDMMDIYAATAEDFEALVGQTCLAAGEGAPVELQLDAVIEAGATMRERGAFSLFFHGPMDAPLPEGVTLVQFAGAEMDLFLLPIGPVEGGLGYEAVFG